MEKPTVAIVVLNYNGWGDTIECLESILRNTYPDYRVIVVDNGSTDNSLGHIKAWAEGRLSPWVRPGQPLMHLTFPPMEKPIGYDHVAPGVTEGLTECGNRLILTRTGANLGYGSGNNVGIRIAIKMGAEYICVLNNDTVVEGRFVDDVASAFQGLSKDVAIIGPKILDYQDLSDWQRPTVREQALKFLIPRAVAFKLKRKLKTDSWLYRMFWYTGEDSAPVYTLPGSCIVFRATVLEKIGGFDENTFLYMEEDILSERLKGLGMAEYYVPSIRLYHKWGQSIGATGLVHLFRSTMYFYKRYRGVGLVGEAFLRLWFLLLFFAKLFASISFRNYGTLKDFLNVFFETRYRHSS
ncbi:MAG: glycosyltransferase family 2 protein [Nitrospirota bacterium]